MNELKENNRITKMFMLLCIISNSSYYPAIQSTRFGRNIVLVAWACVVITVPFFKKNILIFKNSCRTYLILYFCFLGNSLLTTIFSEGNAFSNHFFRPVSVASLIFFIAYHYGDEVGFTGLRSVCLAYMHIMNILSLPLYLIYLRGIDIYSMVYGYQNGKNEIAVLLFCTSVISIFLYKPTGFIWKMYRIIFILVGILDVMTLKCRSVMACYVMMFFFLILFRGMITLKKKVLLVIISVGILVFFFVNRDIWNIIQSYIIYAGREKGNIDSFSSGRITQITMGLEVFQNNILFGVGERVTLDCFYVSVLANYGVGAWSIILMAIFPIIYSMKRIVHRRVTEFDWCLLLIAVGMFVVSCLEELAPFGPGTRCYILWLILGIMIKMEEVEYYE